MVHDLFLRVQVLPKAAASRAHRIDPDANLAVEVGVFVFERLLAEFADEKLRAKEVLE